MYPISRCTLRAKKPAASVRTNRKTTLDAAISVMSLGLAHGLRHRRHHLEHVAHDAVIRDLEDRRLFVLVDRDDRLGRAHAGEMLNCAGDPDGNVELWAHLATRLSDLIAVWTPAIVSHCA